MKNDAKLTGTSGTATIEWIRGAPGTLAVSGTFGGGTVTFHWQTEGGNWVAFKEPGDETTDLSATAARAVAFERLPAVAIRATLSGATGADIEVNAV